MPKDFKHFFSETAELSSLAETLVKDAFAAQYPGERMAKARLRANEAERFVVIVQHGPIAAPKYTCYVVDKSTRAVSELADAAAYLPKR